MFRLLDDEWTPLTPNRKDHYTYRGSNAETEDFHGGRSVVFSLPEATLEKPIADVDLQLHVCKDSSKYVEVEPSRTVGIALISVDHLLNGIIKELTERKDLDIYLSTQYKREPVARSTRGIFTLLNEDLVPTEATITIYIRISYLGDSVVTEMESAQSSQKAFYAREASEEEYPYQFRELSNQQLESGRWGSTTVLPPPMKRELVICRCAEFRPVEEEPKKKKKKAKKRKRSSLAEFRAEERAHRCALMESLRLARGRGPNATTGAGQRTRDCNAPSCQQPCPTYSACPPAHCSYLR